MVMGEARAYAVSVLLVTLGMLQVTAGAFQLLARPELLPVIAMAVGKLAFGLLLFPSARYVAQLRKRGLVLAIVGLSGVVVAHFVPLMVGDRTTVSVVSVLFALVLMVYLFLHEDAFGEPPERQLTEETNTHDFIR